MHDLKRLGGHGLALLLLLLLLGIALTWFYRYFRVHFGAEVALIALALILTGALILMIRGASHTARIHRMLREKAADSPNILKEKRRPLLFRIFDMDVHPETAPPHAPATDRERVRQEIQNLLHTPKKRRGKQARFPLAEIHTAVLEWEQRDPFFSVETLEEFLGRKFGYGADGVLLMATSTFYDWRHRILEELELQDAARPVTGENSKQISAKPPCRGATSRSYPSSDSKP